MFKLTLLLLVCYLASTCNNKSNKSNLPDQTKFKYFDTTKPALSSGMYLIDNNDNDTVNIALRTLYYYFDTSKTSRDYKDHYLKVRNFVSFENVDSVYLQNSNTEYKGFYDVVLNLNSKGREQFKNLTKKVNDLTENEKYDGLLIGTVLKNTLVQIAHVLQPIDTNIVVLSGGDFNEATANDIKNFIRKEKK
jgi:preprotein translocase subunit SecD